MKDFLAHLFPHVVLRKNLNITYTFCLGGLALSALIALGASGVLLLFYYQPHPEAAFNSVQLLSQEVLGGGWVRSLHRRSSDAFLVLIGLHVVRVVWTGAYLPPREWNWVIGVFLFVLSVFGAYCGGLLPMDQKSYWATVTGMELFKMLPLGEKLTQIFVPDGVGQSLSLLRFYILHIFVIPSAIVGLSFYHFYLVRRAKGVLPYL